MENLPSAGSPVPQPAQSWGGHSTKGEETFFTATLQAISAISGSHLPVQSVMNFSPTSKKACFSILQGCSGGGLLSQVTLGEAKHLSSAFGRQQWEGSGQTPPHHPHVEEAAHPDLRWDRRSQATHRRRQPETNRRCQCLTKLWALCVAQDGLVEGWWITILCALHVLQVCLRVQVNEHINCKELPAPTLIHGGGGGHMSL